MQQEKVWVGVDLGGTNLVTAVVNEQGQVITELRVPTEAHRGGDAILQTVVETVKRLLTQLQLDASRIVGLGLGSPGCIDADRGLSLAHTANIPGWKGMKITERLSSELKIAAFADNDVNVTALGEFLFGAGRGVNDMLCITIGTGIGGAVVIGGKVHHGATYYAGEIGHISIDLNGRECGCGRVGCLESYAAAPAIIREAQRILCSGVPTLMNQLVASAEEVTPIIVVQAAHQGDQAAKGILEEVGKCIGAALGGLVNVLNPERIVIGGGVAKAGEILFEAIRRHVQLRALPELALLIQVVPAQLGDQAGVIGAAAMAMRKSNQ